MLPAATPALTPQHHDPVFAESTLDAVVDGLASHGWICVDAPFRAEADPIPALSAELAGYERQAILVEAGVGRTPERVTDRAVRRDRIRWLDGASEPQAQLFRGLDALQTHLNRSLFLGLRGFEAHYALYQPGDFYRRHVDSFRGKASRIVSLVLYLNPSWKPQDGGALRLFDPADGERVLGTLLPQGSRLVCFLSEDIPHEVLPAERTRYSIACWFRRDLPAA